MSEDDFNDVSTDSEMGSMDVDTNKSETILLKVLIVFLTLALIGSIVAYFMLPFDIPMIMPI